MVSSLRHPSLPRPRKVGVQVLKAEKDMASPPYVLLGKDPCVKVKQGGLLLGSPLICMMLPMTWAMRFIEICS